MWYCSEKRTPPITARESRYGRNDTLDAVSQKSVSKRKKHVCRKKIKWASVLHLEEKRVCRIGSADLVFNDT